MNRERFPGLVQDGWARLDAPPSPEAFTALAEPWRPYRTRACLYLWRSLENEPNV